MAELILQSGDWHARVLPDAGGLIAELACGDVPVLRAMPPGSRSPLDAACFPLVPWCNRIADGRFDWEGAAVALARNFLPERHAIHGHGWQSAWAVESHGPGHCTLVHRHDGAAPGWPWAYLTRQQIVLSDARCAITLSVTNLSERLMPAGLGLHPYLRRRPESRVQFAAAGVVAVGADLIPTGESLPPAHFADFSAGAALPAGLIDHCFTGCDGTATVTDDHGTITLAAEGARLLHLYAPEDPAILCLEPVSHLPDAANAGGMPLCAPGETVSLSLRIGVA
ncbi:aldose 1-epimerase [uncultured Erythrobacter sp.]|uniref:aldose 1-epimerase n=1 Tax=uncultured Erythrobacter sp. TaxID=263913 RepID=UPI0026595BDF|nr:aldose 1-epimerase [uncultured Erythrobacter sp.]